MKVLLTGRISVILDSEGGGIIFVFDVIAFAKYVHCTAEGISLKH